MVPEHVDENNKASSITTAKQHQKVALREGQTILDVVAGRSKIKTCMAKKKGDSRECR